MSDNENRSGMQGFSAEDAATQIDSRIYIKTITPAAIECTPERCKVARRPMLLFRVTGFLRDEGLEYSATDPKQEKPFYPLVGDVIAQVYDDNGIVANEYAAPQCYLPGGWHNGMLSALRKGKEVGMSELPMDWEFATAEASNPRGYRWLARNLLQIPRDNPIASLLEHGDKVRAAQELPDFRSERKRITAE